MRRRRVGASGLTVSRLGLGTMGWGTDTDVDAAREQLGGFLDAGGTLVETAGAYGDGAALDVLGGMFAGAVDRDAVVLAVRGAAAGPAGPGRAGLLAGLDAVLRRLGTDHLDLWQLPAWVPDAPLDEVLGAGARAVASGRVRHVGLGGGAAWQLATAAERARTAWPDAAPAAAQVEYSLLARTAEAEILPAAAHHGLGVLAWAPLGRGVLTGKYTDGTPADSRAASAELAGYVEARRNERSARIVHAVLTAADGLGTSPLAVALAWARDRPGVAAAIVGARDAAQLSASTAAEDLTLPAAIRAALDDVSAPC